MNASDPSPPASDVAATRPRGIVLPRGSCRRCVRLRGCDLLDDVRRRQPSSAEYDSAIVVASCDQFVRASGWLQLRLAAGFAGLNLLACIFLVFNSPFNQKTAFGLWGGLGLVLVAFALGVAALGLTGALTFRGVGRWVLFGAVLVMSALAIVVGGIAGFMSLLASGGSFGH